MASDAQAFAKVETQGLDFPALERQMLQFWDAQQIFPKLKAKNAGKPRWSFLDGPITANNPMGVHHAWGRTYKDAYNRYFAMTGRELRYQQGFDCQGLWVEVEVEKELQLQSKRDIENLVPGDTFASIDRFVQKCKDRVNHFARVQTNQSIRLGYWMNWDITDADWAKRPDDRHSYFTMAEENNYTIWQFLKKCHEHQWIYRGYDVMPWCGRCGVGISEQEMKEGYRMVEHRACFVKLPLKDRPGENLLVWTTTPWTLTSNVGAAINPELTYLQVRLKGEIYYVAKGAFKLDRMASTADADNPDATPGKKGKRDWLPDVPHLSSIEQHFKSRAGKEPVEIVGEVKGQEMLGWEYVGPFDDLPAQQHAYGFPDEVAKIVQQRGWCPARSAADSHRVVSGGSDVSDTEGTGIVHTAPGCGQIDFTWGKTNGLPPVAPIDDGGEFVEGFGPLTGKNAADPSTADAVFELLKAKDRLFATERYVHRYPHCWRCKTELLYRLVDEWFIAMGTPGSEEGFRGKIMQVVRKPEVKFLPESINGTARELDWLKNMGDWMISKKRFWGLALPIWVDEKDPTDFEVIGSREELQARAIEGWDEFANQTPHRPWVDKVVIKNPRTGNRMHRIPDVGNPWLDAGIVAFSTMKYRTDPEYWRQWYPAEFITESFPGQFRNWFYSLLALSTLMSDGQPPFKTLLGFATVQDQFGKPMHKSDGNSIEFVGAADEGFELFHDIDPKKDAKDALKDLPKGHLSTREELITLRGEQKKRVFARYKPIGADVIRWLFCKHNPAANLNFGPEPTDEVRAKFVLKLWNVYALFCNYASADGFDRTAEQVPVAKREIIDRWILAELQQLITTARQSFEAFDVMSFAQAAEEFVDANLSNWYVRRNRERFWSKNAELDAEGLEGKLAAYQTLYTCLTTLCQLVAPCVPFLAEVMWQNLRRKDDPESVHLCDYPTPDAGLIDQRLIANMTAVRRVVTLGNSARNNAKIKVRQPLAELKVYPANGDDALSIFNNKKVLEEELNVKKLHVNEANLFEGLLELLSRVTPEAISKIFAEMPTLQSDEEKKSKIAQLGAIQDLAHDIDRYFRDISNYLGGLCNFILSEFSILDEVDLALNDCNYDYNELPRHADRLARFRYNDKIYTVLNDGSIELKPKYKAILDKVYQEYSTPLLSASSKLNMKSAGAKVGAVRKEVEAELARWNAAELKEKLRTGPVTLAGVELEAADVAIEFTAPPGYAGAEDRGTQVALDTRITDELKLEGLTRDAIRQVQEARKGAGLDLADRIHLHLAASGDLGRAIATHRDTIATATQVTQWSDTPLADGQTSTVKIEGQELTISLRKA